MEPQNVDSQPARRGRPPLEPQDEPKDDLSRNRLRMRLAQRGYRARKQQKLTSERARTEQLSKALDQAFSIFTGLYKNLADSPPTEDSSIFVHLNEAASQMTAVAHGVNMDLDLSLPTNVLCPITQKKRISQQAVPASKAISIFLHTESHSPSSMSERIFRACLRRTISILSCAGIEARSPVLTLPLNFLSEGTIMFRSLRRLSLGHLSLADFHYLPQNDSRVPQMYRVVEGGSKAIVRMPAPLVQQIVRGKTRTMLRTESIQLQGEWLEAVDIEEYLEERGIQLRREAPSEGELLGVEEQQQVRKSVSGSQSYFATTPDSDRGKLQKWSREIRLGASADSEAGWFGHEPGVDYSIFGLSMPQQWSGPDDCRREMRKGTVPVENSITPWVGFGHDGRSPGSQITIDLDRLVRLIAAKTVCLGPVPGIRQAAVDSCIRASVVTT